MDRRITDIKWVISLGRGLIILLMTLYRFVKLAPPPEALQTQPLNHRTINPTEAFVVHPTVNG